MKKTIDTTRGDGQASPRHGMRCALPAAAVVLRKTPRFYTLDRADVSSEPPDEYEGARMSLAAKLGYDVTCDVLTTGLRVLQLRKGHRFSNDDLFTAWRASAAKPDAVALLDLGSGIGSVGLSTLAKMRNRHRATLVGIEAQEISFKLATESARLLHQGGGCLDRWAAPRGTDGITGGRATAGGSSRVLFLHGDLRNSNDVLAGAVAAGKLHPPQSASLKEKQDFAWFDLITGSPPYLPQDAAILSPLPQRAPCRVELRGSVYDYCSTAARHLRRGVGARFVFVMLTNDPRTYDAPRRAGLAILEIYDFTFMSGRQAHISTIVCCLESEAPPSAMPVKMHMLIRDRETGNFTEEHIAWKKYMLRDETA